jgi:deoxyadenosine/deoxycytidine kinase
MAAGKVASPATGKLESLPKPILISIEGCIGAGKTTIIDFLKRSEPDIVFIDEPVGVWQALKNEQGEDLLQVFYRDNKRYSYTFQNCALLSRALKISNCIDEWRATNPTKNKIFITERCLSTDYNVFAKMLYNDGKMDLMEWDLYKMWYDHIEKTSPKLSGVIYLDVSPAVCKQHIEKRNRAGEHNISMDYLNRLTKYQDEWLLAARHSFELLHLRNSYELSLVLYNIKIFIDNLME